MTSVFITGVSGFMGRALSSELLRRGHAVTGLVRPGAGRRAAEGSMTVIGDPLDATTYRDHLTGIDTLVHLVGVAHPSPAKAAQFRTIDLSSAKAAVQSAVAAGVPHLVYVSVAHPAPVMREYIAARTEAEDAIRASGLRATILRPWYVLGPGRRWPMLLLPLYWIFERLPTTRESARRLGLVSLEQMKAALVHAVEHPAAGIRIVEAPEIRATRL